jgi:Cu+-exporting ATPase
MSAITLTRDPVCGMEVDPSTVVETSSYGGNEYHFCSTGCKQQFDTAPDQYLDPIAAPSATAAPAALAVAATTAQRCELPLVGMHCASCAGRIEKALGSALGVITANVNFATSRATVQYDPKATGVEKLSQVVRDLGYDVIAAEQGGNSAGTEDPQAAEVKVREAEYRQQKVRFLIALALTIPVAVLAMAGHLVPALEDMMNFPGRVWLELALTTPVLFWAGRGFYTGAWAAARHRSADMNTLVSLGTLSAYFYSVVATVAPGWLSMGTGTDHGVAHGMAMSGGVYYESAAIIVTLILMGRLFWKPVPGARQAAPSAPL